MIDNQRTIFDDAQQRAAVKEILLYMIDHAPTTIGADLYWLDATRPGVQGYQAENFSTAASTRGSGSLRRGRQRQVPTEESSMTIIDSDAHVIDTDHAWDFLQESDRQYRPIRVDELGTDIQVLYATPFIFAVTERPEVELGLARSYNRWLSMIWQRAKGRLRWAAALPLLSMDRTLEELRLVKDHGACAAYMRGIECGDKLVGDPYFYPLYAEASRLDMPVCMHTGTRARR